MLLRRRRLWGLLSSLDGGVKGWDEALGGCEAWWDGGEGRLVLIESYGVELKSAVAERSI